uniref:Death domain-containing protein n=1 Tax=Seriola dumerili TaxID=41447 RepID=A0A3B4UGP6_SERDU
IGPARSLLLNHSQLRAHLSVCARNLALFIWDLSKSGPYNCEKIDKIRPFNTHHLSSVGSEILSAPLQTVLDNLDVLEQLVILLDPDSPTVKNTKHLASHCSFSSTWITYSYSMKDSKSPLKALLEGVTSRYPDWTVGHLAKLLRQMQRNDAIAVLAQLRLNKMAM